MKIKEWLPLTGQGTMRKRGWFGVFAFSAFITSPVWLAGCGDDDDSYEPRNVRGGFSFECNGSTGVYISSSREMEILAGDPNCSID